MRKVLLYRLVALAILLQVIPKNASAEGPPPGNPVKADFSGADIKTKTVNWEVRRAPGKGGENYGLDYFVDDDYVLVEWSAAEGSCISCKGGRDVRVAFKEKGAIKFPAGVHVGTRIDTGGNPVGSGGSYTGTITFSFVPYKLWRKVLIEKYTED